MTLEQSQLARRNARQWPCLHSSCAGRLGRLRLCSEVGQYTQADKGRPDEGQEGV